MIRWTWRVLPAVAVLALTLSAVGVDAQPRTLDGAAIDPDAELVVALADDTNNMDPRIGMGSIRSNYIRQVFESLVDVDQQGKPVPEEFAMAEAKMRERIPSRATKRS